EPPTDRPLLVVRALFERAAARVTAPGDLRRIELDVVRPTTRRTGAAPGDPLDGDLEIEDERQDGGKWFASIVQFALQGLGLGDGAGEAVEQVATARSRQRLHDHPGGDVVRHEIPNVHVRLRQPSQLRAVLDVRSEDLAGGDVLSPERLAEALRLRSLAGPGRPEEHDAQHAVAQRRKPS